MKAMCKGHSQSILQSYRTITVHFDGYKYVNDNYPLLRWSMGLTVKKLKALTFGSELNTAAMHRSSFLTGTILP